MSEAACVVCRRREPVRYHVCEPCRTHTGEMLRELLRKMRTLELQLVPGAGGQGDKVATSRIGSPTPARLDALSLAGPGSDGVTAMMHPLVRRWSTVQTVTVKQPDGRLAVRQITVWYQEMARDDRGQPVLVADDDQIGALPPAEWLRSWVRAWREHFGHHTPPPVPVHHMFLDDRRADMGKRLGLGRALPAAGRPLDPLADEWEARFGDTTRGQQPAADVGYLTTWLDAACDANVGVGDLAAELRALVAELARVLGDRPDQQWLGRCPSTITDTAGGPPRLCGAGLWQDPHASQVVCPRCHAVWGQRQLLQLAMEIRKAWPIDRRRRYHYDEIEGIRAPRCPGCGEVTRITWRDVTATTDDRRWWRPDAAVCPAGCPDTERLI